MKDVKVPRDMEVSNPWAQCIFEGSKTVEVRKDNPASWGSVRIGDSLNIIAKQTQKSQLFKVVDIRVYNSLDECLIAEGVRNVLPGLRTLREARAVYMGFDGATDEAVKQREEEYTRYGCRAIELAFVDQTGIIDISEDKRKDWQENLVDRVHETIKRMAPLYAENGCLTTHVVGSSRPDGDPNCSHVNPVTKQSMVEYNDKTMGGCGSGWDKQCNGCGKVWKA
jgi:ASC-1-like (ASCH) protein